MNRLFNLSIAKTATEAAENRKHWQEQFQALTSMVQGKGSNVFFESAWPDEELKSFVERLQKRGKGEFVIKEIHLDHMILQVGEKIYRASYSKNASGYVLDDVKNWQSGVEVNYLPMPEKQSLSAIILDRAKSIVTGLNPISKNGHNKRG